MIAGMPKNMTPLNCNLAGRSVKFPNNDAIDFFEEVKELSNLVASVANVVMELYRKVDVLEANQASSSSHLAPTKSHARPRRKERVATYTPIAIKHDVFFDILTSKGLITSLPPKEVPVAVKMSPQWRKIAYCRYHQIKGHSI